MARSVIGGLIQAAAPLTDPSLTDREDSRGGDRRAHTAHRGGRSTRCSDPRAAGDLQRSLLLSVAGRALVRHRRAGAGTDHRADGAVCQEVPDGDGRAGVRAGAGRRLLQHRRGLSTRTAAYLGKYRKNHIPHTAGFWEKYFFKPGNLGYPVFRTQFATIGVYICYDRHFPEGARLLGLNGAEIVFNPSATVAGLSQYLWKLEQPAHAVANGYFMACSNRVGTEAPWNIGRFYGTSYFVDPRGAVPGDGLGGQERAGGCRDEPRSDRGGASRLAVLPRSSAGDATSAMAEQLP